MEAQSKLSAIFPSWFNTVIGCVGKRMKSRQRKLKLCESLSLGDKRVLAVVEVGHERLLVGSTAAAITLLTRLPNCDPRNASDSGCITGATCEY
jgi:flagellar biogenesis protein FliO